MDLEEVSEEIRTVLDTIAGLRVPPWGEEKVTPPAALVALPETIDYDETYGRGKDRYPDLAVIVLAGRPTLSTSRKTLAPYVAGSGPASVKEVLEAHAWTSCDALKVTSAEFDVLKYAGNDHLAAILHLDIIGKGA